jgi:DNA-3-methyladenine glycosylase II
MVKTDFSSSIRHLKRDKKLAPYIKRHGALDLTRYHRSQRGVFHALLRSIIYQQISGKAAASILARVEALFPNGKPTPELLLGMSVHKLRAAGLSPQKIGYVRDLAQKCVDKTVDERRFTTMASEEVIAHLTAVKGIGTWTAHMFLIFTLYRPDILPVGDLGIRKGFQIVYGLRALPNERRMEKLARPWREHASAASWYLWRVADEAKKPRAS